VAVPPARGVRFYLDFVSPYAWLALARSAELGRSHSMRWEPRPVVYAALLDAHGLVGPAETEAKRRYTFADVARCADAAGLRLTGPPSHPFRSLEALRVQWLYREHERAMALAVALADAAWGRGLDLTDTSVLARVVAEVGLDADALALRIAEPGVKDGLRVDTQAAIATGVFGVPTFELEGELFWGHDRMDALADRLAGRRPPSPSWLGSFLARPRGVERRRR
jgi:2-hydroxychromene-2-carboxylate isomerase